MNSTVTLLLSALHTVGWLPREAAGEEKVPGGQRIPPPKFDPALKEEEARQL